MEIRDRRRGFLWLNNEIVDEFAPKVGPTALLVYLYLCRFANNVTESCWPKQDRIAEFCKCSDRTIRSSLAKLEACGLIAVQRQKVGELSQNIYTLLAIPTGNTLPVTPVPTGNQRPNQPEAPDPLTRLKNQQDLNPLSSPSVPTGDSFQLNGDEVPNHQKKTGDPRHVPFKNHLIKFWLHVNPEFTEYRWDAGDAGQLGKFLTKWPGLTLKELHGWLEHYRDSDGVVTTKTPKQFLPALHEYAIQPLDQYRKPIQEKRVYDR